MRGAALILAVLLACAGSASASETDLWAKAGATRASVDADLASCKEEARKASYHVSAPNVSVVVPGGFAAGAAGGAAGYLVQALILHHREQNAEATYDRHCMRRHGYVWLPLSTGEATALDKVKTPQERTAWIDAFYAGDLAARIEAASKPVVPPLPEAAEEPLTFAGVRLDPAALSVASGPVAEGQKVLTGKVGHRRTARLKRAVDLQEPFHLDAPAGTVFHELVLPTDYELEQTIWCGPMRSHGIVRIWVTCVWSTEFGYAVVGAGGQPWLASLFPDVPARTNSVVDFSLSESDDDLIGPMDFALVVKRLTDKAASLEAQASRDGKTVTFWKGNLAFDPEGRALLPFWTHRLTLTRAGKTVTAAFTPDGDGPGWYEAELAS